MIYEKVFEFQTTGINIEGEVLTRILFCEPLRSVTLLCLIFSFFALLACSLLWNEIHQSVQNLEQERPIVHVLLLPLHRTECLAILSLFLLPSHTNIRTQLLAQLFLSSHQPLG